MWTMKVTTRQYNVTCYIAGMCSGLTHSFHDEVDAELSSSRHPACEVVCGVVTDHDPYRKIKIMKIYYAGPKITLHFPCLYIYICASTLITCTIITARIYIVAMRPYLVDFGNLDGGSL